MLCSIVAAQEHAPDVKSIGNKQKEVVNSVMMETRKSETVSF